MSRHSKTGPSAWWAWALCSVPLCAAEYVPRRTGDFNFPVYRNQAAGKQLTGAYAPAATPALAPEETEKRFKVPPGFEVRLFASEPEVVNPVAMTWDERGRLWVVEFYEYPMGAPPGQRGRDRVKILEDTDADGRADRATVFADGFSLATGIALGNGGVYLGVAPDLLFLEDTDGDDVADRARAVLTGFGLEDRHELLNSFAWGPDGWLYLTHGVFTHSEVRDPDDPDDDGVRMNAALARFDPRRGRFEVFADGTSNPWGVDWNDRGDALVSACVIHHLFHMAPGGLYNRQSGTWPNPYGYVQDLPTKGLPAIVDWRHYRAAHAGVCVYQGDQWPAAWQGLVLLGNIHQSAINCDRLLPVGATYRAVKEDQLLGASKGDWEVGAGNFLVCDDHWFRPVSVQTGPDGALWVMDWSDKYPCYQNAIADPVGVDRELGRIWRVVWVGNEPGQPVPSRPARDMDLRKSSDATLVGLLDHSNSWQRRQAQRLLLERQAQNALASAAPAQTEAGRRQLAWARLAAGAVPAESLGRDADPVIRAWANRAMGDRSSVNQPALASLRAGCADGDVTVRAAAASALRRLSSGSLTVNTAPVAAVATAALLPHFGELLSRPSAAGDFYYPHIVWMAMEPRVALEPAPFLALLARHPGEVSAYCARRTLRRVGDLTGPADRLRHLDAAMEWLGTVAEQSELAGAALDGLIEAFRAKAAPPSIALEPIFERLTANPTLADRVRRLATLLGDTRASLALIARINDSTATPNLRRRGIQAARETGGDTARQALFEFLVSQPNSPGLLTDALRALAVFPDETVPGAILKAWSKLDPPARRVATEVLTTRRRWSGELLAAVDQKTIAPEEVSATARRALARSDDPALRDEANRLLGRYRPPEADKLKLIAEKRKVVLAGTPDLNAGRAVAQATCFVCHKLHGEGAEVGPDLTGVGRSTLDALLQNVIDPNEVIGHGYENTEVELKDGTVLSGRVIEDTPNRIRLLASGPTEHVVARADIAEDRGRLRITRSELSLMPEGFEQMPDADFRNLIWYLLNPPGDNRPWTPELYRELTGVESSTDHRFDVSPP